MNSPVKFNKDQKQTVNIFAVSIFYKSLRRVTGVKEPRSIISKKVTSKNISSSCIIFNVVEILNNHLMDPFIIKLCTLSLVVIALIAQSKI